jgi:hypothetical protein
MPLVTSDVTLPSQIADGIVEKINHGSTITALSSSEPMRFGDVSIVTFDDDLTAEFVEEGAAKTADNAKPDVATAVPHKTVVNFRTSNEFLWAEEDYQLGILDKFEEKCARALARALDFGAYHRINPRTGNVISAWPNFLDATTKRVAVGASADMDVEQAVGLVIADSVMPTGIAFDPAYSWTLATARYNDGRKKYPELGFGVAVTSFEGLKASVSNTVSGQPESTDTGLRAIVGDYDQGIRWGVQRNIPFRVIEYGDPDNTGRDLAGHNEVLFRAEVVYAWKVFEGRFAVIETTPAGS